MASAAVDLQPSVVARVASLPLVSSTRDLVSSVYVSTKDQHPYLQSVCEMAERGVRAVTSVAVTGVLPLMQKLEPQLAVANTYACEGLDKIEERLPILTQPTSQVIASARGAVTGAREAVAKTVTGAQDSVASMVTGVVDRTKGAVSSGVERTRSVVRGGIHSVLESRVVQLVSSGVESALATSELLVDRHLPLTEEELEKEAKKVEGFDVVQKPSYYIRLGSLSSKLRARAYQQALARVRDAQQKSQEAISQLHAAVCLTECARRSVHNASRRVQDAQEQLFVSWVEWKRSTGRGDTDGPLSAEHVESRTLAVARSLMQQLRASSCALLSGVQGLPKGVRDQARQLGLLAGDVRGAASFTDVSDSLLASSRGQLQRATGALDAISDYLLNNTPLNWLVGPFYPELSGAQAAESRGSEPLGPGPGRVSGVPGPLETDATAGFRVGG